ncbi:MAG: shikimate kinase, partial [Patescibacteria group bacterium]|nr:shikimate kinase [Patescibacteria group bacterium]
IILNKSGKKSINEIFEKHGEKKFRELEQRIATTLVNKKNIVVSSGGGVIMNNITMNLLKEDSIIVFLSTDFTTIEKRLVNTANRPLWKNIEQTKKLFKIRQPLYMLHADITVVTDGKSLEKITEEIVERMAII